MRFKCGSCDTEFVVSGVKESVVTCSTCGSRNSIRESEDIDNIPVNSEDTKLLIKAIRETDMSTVEQLIDSGTDLMQETPTGDSPLSVAIEKNNFEAVKLIIAKNRATVNKIGSDTRSPLLIALGWNRLKIARLLLDNGANIKYRDKAGYNALRIAKDKGKLGTPGGARMLKLITDYSSNEAVDYISRDDTVTRVAEATAVDSDRWREIVDDYRSNKSIMRKQFRAATDNQISIKAATQTAKDFKISKLDILRNFRPSDNIDNDVTWKYNPSGSKVDESSDSKLKAVDYITRGDTVTRVAEAISPDVRSLIDTVRLRKDYVLSQIAKQGVDITTGSGRRIPCSSRGSGIFKDKVEGVVAIISLNMAGQFSRITFFPKDLDKDCSFSINDTPGYKYNAYFFEIE